MSLLSPKHHFDATREIFDLLTRHRQLTWEMAKREISDRYAGQAFGALWAVGHPLFLMGIYVFVFAYIFKQKIGGTYELPLDYTAYILSGLIPWMAFQECMAKSSTAIVANANLVKQVVFPIEILPVKGVIASLLTQVISLSLLLCYVLATARTLPWTCALLPLLVALQTCAMIGVAYVLSAVGAYFRDIKDFVQVFCQVGMYVMPVFYLPSWVPETLRPALYANPFSYLAWCYQDALYFGRFEHPWAWVVFASLSLGCFYFGYRVFRKLKVMFGNVL